MKVRILLGLLVFSLMVGGCTPDEVPKATGDVIKIASNYWPGKFWIDIADEKGWFEEAGLQVELVNVFDDYYGSILGTVEGKTDINGVALYDLVSFNAEGKELVMFINADNAATSDALVVRDGIKDYSYLKGKKIAVSEGFYTDYMLQVVLQEHSLNSVDVIQVHDYKDEDMAQAFIDGKIDGFLSWQPQINIALANGAYVLWDASQKPGISPNGQVALRSYIDSHPEQIQAYVNVWQKATLWMKDNQKEGFQIISSRYGFPAQAVEKFYNSENILDLADNKIAFTYAAGFESLHGSARQINKFMRVNGITDKDLDTTKFIDARFIRGVEE